MAPEKAANSRNAPNDRDRFTLATVLRNFRLAAGLSQAELAERSDMSIGAVGSLEQGLRRAPYRSTVDSLANALELTDEQRVQLHEVANHGRGRQRSQSPEVPFTSNLPARLSSFVSRSETDEIGGLLATHRLVTVTGFAGVGKTRTVLEVVAAHDSSDVIFIDLSAINDIDLVVLEIASVCGISIHNTANASRDLVEALIGRRAWIVLDNCEQVITGVAAVVLQLLKSCPEITIVATSREPLGLSSEVVYRLPFLSFPPKGTKLSVGSEYSALELFVIRARATDARLTFSPDDLEAAADICRRLDGIPLAIELAAGRASALGVGGLRDRLNDWSFRSAAKDVPARQQTMAAAIAWSFGLLTATENILIRRLSTLAGSFSIRCAETVCADDLLPAALIADLVVQLVQKSLVESKPTPAGFRYAMLASVRAYASSGLASAGETEANEDRLARYLLSLVRDAPGGDSSSVDVPDIEDIRAAIEAKLRHGSDDDVALAGTLAGSFRHRFWATGRYADLRRLGELILARLDGRKHPGIAALVGSALLAARQPDQGPLLERAIMLNELAGNHASAAAHLGQIAMFYVKRNQQSEALDAAEKADALLSLVPPNHRAQHFVRSILAFVWSEAGDVAKARQYIQTVDGLLRSREENNDRTALTSRNAALAEIEFASGNYASARTLCIQAAKRLRDGEDQVEYGAQIKLMAAASQLKLNEFDAAQAQCRAVLDNWHIIERCGSEFLMADVAQNVALIFAARGEGVAAAQLLGCSNALFARFEQVRGFQQRSTHRDLRDVLEREIEPENLSDLEFQGSQMTIAEARDLIYSVLDD